METITVGNLALLAFTTMTKTLTVLPTLFVKLLGGLMLLNGGKLFQLSNF